MLENVMIPFCQIWQVYSETYGTCHEATTFSGVQPPGLGTINSFSGYPHSSLVTFATDEHNERTSRVSYSSFDLRNCGDKAHFEAIHDVERQLFPLSSSCLRTTQFRDCQSKRDALSRLVRCQRTPSCERKHCASLLLSITRTKLS
jgi:hypothetical protein